MEIFGQEEKETRQNKMHGERDKKTKITNREGRLVILENITAETSRELDRNPRDAAKNSNDEQKTMMERFQ